MAVVIADPVAAFIEAACVPRDASHGSGNLEQAERILSQNPHVPGANIYTASILADEVCVRAFLLADPNSATATGGPHGWDALTYLCFSRYLRLDETRAGSFVSTAQTLLDSGANAKSGWYEIIDHPNPRSVFESLLYGAAGIARHPELTRLLLDRGADPNDEETPYHVPETYDNTVLKVLLESGKLNHMSLTWMLLRKTDWHDYNGLRILLDYGVDPNTNTRFGNNSLHHALRRDNSIRNINLLLDHAADPALRSERDGRSAFSIAARRGRIDVLKAFEKRNFPLDLQGVDELIAACAKGDREAADLLIARERHLSDQLLSEGGTLLAEFAGNGNVAGLQCLLDLGVNAGALYKEGDPYFDIAQDSTALHVAAWRAHPSAVKELIERGSPVNSLDSEGRTPLALAVKACVDSHWTERRSPDSVATLLKAGATVNAIEVPSGYGPVDELLRSYRDQ